jgi:uncharacterized Rmd1/YagE family protein
MAFLSAPGVPGDLPCPLGLLQCSLPPSAFVAARPRQPPRRRTRAAASAGAGAAVVPIAARAAQTSAWQSESGGNPAEEQLVRRVASYCVADELRMAPLYRRLLRDTPVPDGLLLASMGSNVLLISRPSCQAFCFSYGCIIVWGSRPEDEHEILGFVAPDAIVPRAVPVVEALEWTYGRAGGIAGDRVTLEANAGDGEEGVLEKLAISFALSQSIKLQAFEIAIRDTIESTRYLPEEMARRGRISARRSEIAAALGALFLHRYAFNLNSDVVNTPHFFWENEEYLATYRRAERYMELGQRTTRHNAQLNALQDLLELLATSESTYHMLLASQTTFHLSLRPPFICENS